MSMGIFTSKYKKAAKARAERIPPERRHEIATRAIATRWENPDIGRRIFINIPNSSLSVLKERAQKSGRTPEEEAAEIVKSFTTQWDV